MDAQRNRIAVRSAVPVAAAAHFVLAALSARVAALGAWLLPGPVVSLSFDGPASLSFARVPPAQVFLWFPFPSAVAGAAISARAAWPYNGLARRFGPVRITRSG